MSTSEIDTESQPTCLVCGRSGSVKYEGLTDRVFGASGAWTMMECSDARCGTLWLNPRPTPADIGKAYGTYYTHGVGAEHSFIKRAVRVLACETAASHYGFDSSRLPFLVRPLALGAAAVYPGLKAHLELLIRYLPSPENGNGKLLDVGCGDGEALDILRELGWQVSGVEFDAQAVSAARKRGLDIRQGTLSDVRFDDNTFNAVTSSHVIEHVHDPHAFLAESRRVLRLDGTLVAVTPNVRARSHEMYGRNWRGLEPPRHLVMFTAESLLHLAESVGLRQVRVFTTPRAVALSDIASSKIRDEGRCEEGKWPGLPTWLRAQMRQWRESWSTKDGDTRGNELVLMATK